MRVSSAYVPAGLSPQVLFCLRWTVANDVDCSYVSTTAFDEKQTSEARSKFVLI